MRGFTEIFKCFYSFPIHVYLKCCITHTGAKVFMLREKQHTRENTSSCGKLMKQEKYQPTLQ